MQWKWLVRTKLLLAGMALILLVGDGLAGPFSKRKANKDQGWTYVQPTTTTTQAAPGVQPATATATTQANQGQWVTQRRGLFGRKSEMVWQEFPATQVVQQPQPGAVPPAAEVAPMPSATPTTTTARVYQSFEQPVANQRRGLFGRRSNGRTGYTPAPTASTQQGTTRQAFYPAVGQAAYIDVRLPVAGAEILFDGARTSQQGINRLFVTPALDPQRDNTYEVKARWTDQAGQPVEQTRQVKVPAGGRVIVDFTMPQQP